MPGRSDGQWPIAPQKQREGLLQLDQQSSILAWDMHAVPGSEYDHLVQEPPYTIPLPKCCKDGVASRVKPLRNHVGVYYTLMPLFQRCHQQLYPVGKLA